MAQENVNLDTVDLGEFGKDLNDNSFGIQDTQILASEELKNFLISDTTKIDPTKITKVESEKKEDEVKGTKPEDEKKEVTGEQALNNFLFTPEQEETEDDETKVDTNKIDPNKQNQPSVDDETYTTLGKDLMRLGVFTPNEDDETEDNISIKTSEDFLERFKSEQKKGAVSILDNFLSQFGEDYRKAFDAIFVSGVDPKEYLTTFSRINSVKDLDLTTEDNQKKVLREYYRSLKWDDSKIDNKIEKLKDYGELEDEAKSYHEVLLNKEKEKEETLIATKQKETEAKKQIRTATIQSYQRVLQEKLQKKEIDGIPLDQKTAQEVLNYLANEPYKLDNGELLSEYDKDLLDLNRPENVETKIKVALLMRKKFDLTIVKKTAASKKAEELFTVGTKSNKKTEVTTQPQKSFFS